MYNYVAGGTNVEHDIAYFQVREVKRRDSLPRELLTVIGFAVMIQYYSCWSICQEESNNL